MKALGPALPLTRDERFGNYSLITSYKEEVIQNFKNLLLTLPGERVMNPDFGVGIKKYLFENKTNIKPKIRQRIESQTNKYMPFIRINGIFFNEGRENLESNLESHILSITVNYEVPTLNLTTDITFHTGDNI